MTKSPDTPATSTSPTPPTPRPPVAWSRAEWVVLVLLTVAAVALRVRFAVSAGGLWRDEINSANLASAPTLAAMYADLQTDSYPALYLLLLRSWMTLFGGGDASLRTLGLILSLLLPVAAWWACRQFRVRPGVTLLFCGLGPALVTWAGVSNRAYGLGVALLALAVGAAWRAYARPTAANRVLLAVAVLLAMQTLFYNAVLLSGVLGVLIVFALVRRRFRDAVVFVAVGLCGGASMAIYLPMIRSAAEWSMLVKMPIGPLWLLRMLGRTLNEGGAFVPYVFAVVIAAAGVAAVLAVLRARSEPSTTTAPPVEQDLPAFALATAVVSVALHFGFLLHLSYPTASWYYATVVLMLTLTADVALGVTAVDAAARRRRVVMLIVLTIACLPGAWLAVGRRQTNVDVVARYLNDNARRGDVILVHPWFVGITFDRYYHGPADWATLPPTASHRLHRLILIKRAFADPAAARPVLDRMTSALAAGHRVWLIGEFPAPGDTFPGLPPLPGPADSAFAWNEVSRDTAWAGQAVHTVHAAGASITPVGRLVTGRVNFVEDMPLSVAERH